MMSSIAIPCREQRAEVRNTNFEEVVFGYNEEEACKEAGRCLQCAVPRCSQGCPVGIDIKKFIAQIVAKDFRGAYLTIREKNNFPAICGRVCPAEYQCRKACVLTPPEASAASSKAINIHFLERFAADVGGYCEKITAVPLQEKFAKDKVAVIGSGPAGLCVAGELAKTGIKVEIFESLHKPGGVLEYGIPSFRLPRDILSKEISAVLNLGVKLHVNCVIGHTLTLEDLFFQKFNAVFVGTGAGVPMFLKIPGENFGNVYSANEFLTRVNLMRAHKFPEYHTPLHLGRKIVVIGGGNTAMDSARVAIRIQRLNHIDPDVTLLYRRTENELPARRLEIEHAREEGIKFEFLVQPVRFLGKDNLLMDAVECVRCHLGAPDTSGRRRPVVTQGSNFVIPADHAIIAIGLQANQVFIRHTKNLQVDHYGNIVINEKTMGTSIPGVFAGGDIVGGEGTVIEAMGMGKRAAKSIINFLSNNA